MFEWQRLWSIEKRFVQCKMESCLSNPVYPMRTCIFDHHLNALWRISCMHLEEIVIPGPFCCCKKGSNKLDNWSETIYNQSIKNLYGVLCQTQNQRKYFFILQILFWAKDQQIISKLPKNLIKMQRFQYNVLQQWEFE